MGYTGTLAYRYGRWQRSRTGQLVVAIMNSDIATVEYSPAPPGCGRFHLGFQPRDWFEDPMASVPVDLAAEAHGLAAWAAVELGRRVDPDDVRPLMAAEGTEDPLTDFVEDTLFSMLELLGVPLPPQLLAGVPAGHPDVG